MSRGTRNNNIGNIMKSTDQWEGLVGYDEDGYAIFDSPESGIRAKGRVLMTYGRKGYNTLPKIFERYAPKGHGNNDPAAYAQFVANETGFGLNDVLDLNDENTLMKLVQAIAVQENGREAVKQYTPEQYLAGVQAALSGRGITPKGKPIASEDNPLGLGEREVAPTVGTELPDAVGFSTKGVEQAPKRKSYSQEFFDFHGETIDQKNDKSTWFGFGDVVEAEASQSLLGVAFRTAKMENGLETLDSMLTPTMFNRHEFTEEEIERIRREVKDPAYFNAVGGATPTTLDNAIKLANENYEDDKARATAGVTANLAGGVFGAAIDPLSYVPLVGISGKGLSLTNKVLRTAPQVAVASGVSEMYLKGISGGEAHYTEAMIGGALFGGGMTMLSDMVGKALRKGKTEHVPLDEAGSVPNEFANQSMRLEARETARNTGGDDLSKAQPADREFDMDAAVPYAKHPTEDGAVILQDRSVISAENPLNPQTLKEFREVNPESTKAARGVDLGGFSELGYKVLRSENEKVREIGSDLVRSPTGNVDGSSGKFGATASDIHMLETSLDNRDYNALWDSMKLAMKDVEWTVGDVKFSKDAIKQEIYRRAVTAIERPELQANLTKAEHDVMTILKGHLDRKRESMENPAKYGDMRAKGFFPESRHKGTYFPHVYSRSAKAMYTQAFGGADNLQKAIARSWEASYAARPEVKARVDEYLKEVHGVTEVTPDMVSKYANDKAYGISHSDQFHAESVLEEISPDISGLANNKFLEARNLFDSDVPVFIEGQPFKVNDLREFDASVILPSYDRRVNGDIAIMGGTGKTTKELVEHIGKLKEDAKATGKSVKDVEYLEGAVKMLTGRSRRDPEGGWETMARAVQDLSFVAKNAYMGVQNFTEIGGMLAKGNTRALLHGIPVLRDLAFRKKPVSGKEVKELHSMLFGKELDDTIRPRRQDIVQRLRDGSEMSNTMANVVGTIKFGTGELARRNPFTKILTNSTNYLLDAGRQGALGDVVSSVISGKKSRWGDPRFLNGASVSKEQWEGIQALIRENISRGDDGKFIFKDKKKMQDDPRSMDLWRLMDKVASETLLRTTNISSADAKAHNAWMGMLTQFKTFTLRSLNGKFVRSFHEATKNKRALDVAFSFILSSGLAATYYVAQAHVKALGLPENERDGYLARALNPKMIAYASAFRSSHAGAPLSVAGMLGSLVGFDDYKYMRSTINPKESWEKPQGAIRKGRAADWFVEGIGGAIMEQSPPLNYLANVAASGRNAYLAATAKGTPEQMDAMTALMNSTKELVPNDPITQQLLMHIYAEQGIYIKK